MLYNTLHNRWLRLIAAVVGELISAAALNLFIVPLNLYNGGLLGLCQIIRTLMQEYADRESDGDQYIANMRHGATAGFKYFAFDGSECTISLTGTGTGAFEVSDGEKQIAVVPVNGQTGMKIEAGIKPLYFTYIGNDTASFVSFSIA